MDRRFRLALFSSLLLLLCACGIESPSSPDTPLHVRELHGWEDQDHREALRVFLATCRKLSAAPSPPNLPVISAQQWREVCDEASRAKDAKRFFESRFRLYPLEQQAHYTAYFIPTIRGSLRRGARYRWPAYALPPELKNPGDKPYFNRAEIDAGALSGRGLEILWLDDPVALFFAHIQGSAVAELPDGRRISLRYAGKNGLPYTPIGRVLIERGELTRENVSMQRIMAWLKSHPDRADDIMRQNASYVFFSLDDRADGIPGAAGVALTPHRSVAADPAYLPIGWPVFAEVWSSPPYAKLMVAQDTGTAIKGEGRIDLFFGYGEAAGEAAGRMDARGLLYLLVPDNAG